MTDKQLVGPENTAVRAAWWRAPRSQAAGRRGFHRRQHGPDQGGHPGDAGGGESGSFDTEVTRVAEEVAIP